MHFENQRPQKKTSPKTKKPKKPKTKKRPMYRAVYPRGPHINIGLHLAGVQMAIHSLRRMISLRVQVCNLNPLF